MRVQQGLDGTAPQVEWVMFKTVSAPISRIVASIVASNQPSSSSSLPDKTLL